jgi:Ca-activated chloride channel family protein
VIRLAKKFGLVTPYTSYLAVDDSEFEQRDQRVRVDRDRRLPPPRDRAPEMGADEEAAPEPKSAARRPKKKAFENFFAPSGEGAVAASEATREYQEQTTVDKDDSSVSRRFVSGRTFERKGKTWVQVGLSKRQRKKAKTVTLYSKKYFELMRKHPELKKVAGRLGSDFIVKVGKRTYHIQPK